jgi:hypothetical protein
VSVTGAIVDRVRPPGSSRSLRGSRAVEALNLEAPPLPLFEESEQGRRNPTAAVVLVIPDVDLVVAARLTANWSPLPASEKNQTVERYVQFEELAAVAESTVVLPDPFGAHHAEPVLALNAVALGK